MYDVFCRLISCKDLLESIRYDDAYLVSGDTPSLGKMTDWLHVHGSSTPRPIWTTLQIWDLYCDRWVDKKPWNFQETTFFCRLQSFTWAQWPYPLKQSDVWFASGGWEWEAVRIWLWLCCRSEMRTESGSCEESFDWTRSTNHWDTHGVWKSNWLVVCISTLCLEWQCIC